MRRLRNDHPQLHKLVLDGTLSPFRAAIVAGIRKQPGRRPRRSADLSEPATHEILLELWLGPHPDRGSLFNTPEELRAAWDKHKDEVMRMWAQRGHRPRGFWEFETDLEYPGYDREPRFLYENGKLSADECALLEAQWKKEEPEAETATTGSDQST